VIESTTQQQLAKIAAAAATTIAEHDTITNTTLTHSDSCQAQPCARTLAHTFDLHARSICKFSQSHLARGYQSELDRPIRRTFIELTHAAERESTDITTPVLTSSTELVPIAASSASTDARIGTTERESNSSTTQVLNTSADACNANQDARSGIHKDAYTSASIMPVPSAARDAPATTVSKIMPVPHARDTTAISNQTRQLQRAPQIVPVSFPTRDDNTRIMPLSISTSDAAVQTLPVPALCAD